MMRLANRLAAVELGEVDVARTNDLAAEARAGDLRQRMLYANERMARRALDGAPIRIVRVRRCAVSSARR